MLKPEDFPRCSKVPRWKRIGAKVFFNVCAGRLIHIERGVVECERCGTEYYWEKSRSMLVEINA